MVKRKVEWSKNAKLDLYGILDFYIIRNGSITYSKRLFSKINRSISLISKNPYIGKKTDINSVRILITGDYLIIYEIFDQLVLVIMLWDSRRNPDEMDINKRIIREV